MFIETGQCQHPREINDNQFLQGKITKKPIYQRDFYKLSNNVKDILKEDFLESIPDLSVEVLVMHHFDSL